MPGAARGLDEVEDLAARQAEHPGHARVLQDARDDIAQVSTSGSLIPDP